MLTPAHFGELCADPLVRAPADALAAERKPALYRFWKRLGIGTLISIGALIGLIEIGWPTTGWIILFLGLICTIVAATAPISSLSEGLKHPALSKLAEMTGMEFIPSGFDPPAYRSVTKLLFGDVSSATFTDLFHGTDEAGRGRAFYEANLQGSVGGRAYVIFSGQIYAFQHEGPENFYAVLRADRKMFNFFRPARDMARVSIASNEAFERKFELYSTDADAALRFFGRADVQQSILDLRKAGRIFICLTPTEALFAINGKNRFEPGSMFRQRAALDRVRLMFDDFCEALRILRRLEKQFRQVEVPVRTSEPSAEAAE